MMLIVNLVIFWVIALVAYFVGEHNGIVKTEKLFFHIFRCNYKRADPITMIITEKDMRWNGAIDAVVEGYKNTQGYE